MSNNKQQTPIEWLREEITYDNGTGQRLGSFIETVDLTEYFNKAKEMENEDYLGKYSDGYLEGFNRALALVELTVEEHKDDIYYDRGLAKIHTRIKELKV
jgi:hypothetical protein